MKTSKGLKKLSMAVGLTSVVSIGSLCFQTSAQAAAIIDNGTIQLGVNDFGHLNVGGGTPSSGTGTTNVGLRFLPTGAEATAPGCLCEGWGVADAFSGITGYANENEGGAFGLVPVSFSSTADSATSVVMDTSGLFEVTHKYVPDSRTDSLYRTEVTIKNIGSSKITDLRYRRVMDWDVEPTAFTEFSTIQGTAGATNVLFASNDGFASANPLSGQSSISGITGDFVDAGPFDHGALFDFGFGGLDIGNSFSFDIFYGAAPTEGLALAALSSVGAEVYSFGQSSVEDGATTGKPNTFIFAFKGVGGTPVDPPGEAIPTPALLPGLIGLGVAALRKRKGEAAEESSEA